MLPLVHVVQGVCHRWEEMYFKIMVIFFFCLTKKHDFFTNLIVESDEESYSPVCSDDEEEEDQADDTKRDISSNLYNNPNANCTDHTIIMNLLDIAARSEPIEDNLLLDKEEDEEISQGINE